VSLKNVKYFFENCPMNYWGALKDENVDIGDGSINDIE
jgi:hypothetical protein